MTVSRSIENLADLIAYPTVSSEPNLEMIDYLHERLDALGYQ